VPEVESKYCFIAKDPPTPSSEKMRIVIEEPVLHWQHYAWMDPIQENAEIVYSLVQTELTDLVIKLVSASSASANRAVVYD
jgi:hypothetical protein